MVPRSLRFLNATSFADRARARSAQSLVRDRLSGGAVSAFTRPLEGIEGVGTHLSPDRGFRGACSGQSGRRAADGPARRNACAGARAAMTGSPRLDRLAWRSLGFRIGARQEEP